jgi:hypothetical protein
MSSSSPLAFGSDHCAQQQWLEDPSAGEGAEPRHLAGDGLRHLLDRTKIVLMKTSGDTTTSGLVAIVRSQAARLREADPLGVGANGASFEAVTRAPSAPAQSVNGSSGCDSSPLRVMARSASAIGRGFGSSGGPWGAATSFKGDRLMVVSVGTV